MYLNRMCVTRGWRANFGEYFDETFWSFWTASEPGPNGRQIFHCQVPLADAVTAIGREVLVTIDPPRRPAHLDRIDAIDRPESEMEPGIAG